ncbi:MAG: multifunctional CCA addition/repair protein [Pseudohongiellaceae bacterium]
MKIFLVGGAVRDKQLGLPVTDRDWVVVGATVQDMLSQKYRQVGKDFPVFLHPQTHDEYALARTERKTGPGYKGFAFDTSSSVTLEEDLQRRDLTINSMAEDAGGNLIDPYNGSTDIRDRLLRHVSPAFSEDPLRVLRVARFAARFAALGFQIADETLHLMQTMAASGELEALAAERVWQEFSLALDGPDPAVFIKVLRDCGALQVILPEVDRLFGVPQPEKYHPEIDTGVHTLMCLQQAVLLSDDVVVRYAVLVHDVGKGVTPKANWPHHYQHENLGLKLQRDIAERLRVPREHAEIARLVCEHHTKMHRLAELRSATILELLESLDAFRRPQRLQQFLLACEADARGRTGFEKMEYSQRALLRSAYEAAASLDAQSLIAERKDSTHDIGEFLRQHRISAIRHCLGKQV